MKKIVDCVFEEFYGEIQITAIFKDGTEEFLFGFVPSEEYYSVNDFIGKTKDEAMEMFALR